MTFQIAPMSKALARRICRWIYEPPYEIYSMEDTEETLRELLSENYHAVCDVWGEPVGFFCYGRAARVPQGFELYGDEACDIGLALAPELCGKGLGLNFLLSGLEYGRALYPGLKAFRLTVMDWNQRAISLYRRLGFVELGRFQRCREEEITTFIVMLRKEGAESAV